MTHSFTISVLATIDPVLRTSATLNLALDLPGLVSVTHDLLDGEIRRIVADGTGIIEDTLVPLEHSCLSCAIREDVIPTLARLQQDGRWDAALVALPITAEPAPLLRALEDHTRRGGALGGATYGATLTIVDGDTLEDDAFADTFVVDHFGGLQEDDDRTVAEALAPQLAIADAIVLISDTTPPAGAVAAAQHLRGDGARVSSATLTDIDVALLDSKGRVRDTLERANPLRSSTRTLSDEAGVWTLRLESPHPFHPGRLRENLHRLADHPTRARGVFWIAARPSSACLWEGASRQLSVGEGGTWGRRLPRTHLTITGRGEGRGAIADAFTESLARPEELPLLMAPDADALVDWLGESDSI